jgi:hypothetical protein
VYTQVKRKKIPDLKKVLTVPFLIALCTATLATLPPRRGAAETGMQKVYSAIVAASERLVPEEYLVQVENEQFAQSLRDLPEDILTGEPSVVVKFRKGAGVKMFIDNVKSEYANLFAMYERYLQLSGITKVQNPEEFKRIMDQDLVVFRTEDESSITIQAWDPETGEKGDDYALFTLDKKRWMIRKAVYYLDGSPFMQLDTTYEFYGEYYLPMTIALKNLAEDETEVFRFKEYRFDV